MSSLSLLCVTLLLFSPLLRVANALVSYEGSVCAFADLNFDRYTDIIVKNSSAEGGVRLNVLFSNPQDWNGNPADLFRPQEDFNISIWTAAETKNEKKDEIVGCFVSDFDGDSFPDLLLTLKVEKQQYRVKFCPGQYNQRNKDKKGKPNLTGFECSSSVGNFLDHPTVLDYNVDAHIDFFTTDKASGKLLCFSDKNKNALKEGVDCPFGYGRKIIQNFMHVYADISGDLNADLLLGVEGSGDQVLGLELWQLGRDDDQNLNWTLKENFAQPFAPKSDKELLSSSSSKAPKLENLGYLSVDDFDGDGLIDLILPECDSSDEPQCHLHVWSRPADLPGDPGQWYELPLSLTETSDKQWKVLLDANDKFQLRSGDWTLDGYPDLLVILHQDGDDNKRQIFVLENKLCNKDDNDCNGWSRKFVIQWDLKLITAVKGKLTFTSFFDLLEDGNLDLLFEYQNNTGQYHFKVLSTEDKGDTTFLKVQVTTPLCIDNCTNGREGTGIACPGATSWYSIEQDFNGLMKGTHSQLSQTSHRAMQLPFSLFGLGRNPNFVEELRVGVPSWPSLNRSWPQIVPNARLYILPELSSSAHWVNRLYLTPSRLILLSAAALCCCSAVILLLIAFLQWREHKQDLLEKEQASHRFHFDAM